MTWQAIITNELIRYHIADRARGVGAMAACCVIGGAVMQRLALLQAHRFLKLGARHLHAFDLQSGRGWLWSDAHRLTGTTEAPRIAMLFCYEISLHRHRIRQRDH
ncbi:hypothetical protein [Xanthomonas campestris]|uniref:hypothetical protein n=1 Tax=Xanthomonas campestris TaxID=339 RepID=UPI0011C07D4C|nr:hypothetical protein [Xanthomonas campestris]MEA9845649.1 hypothetical protein [Xanthomonas campestris pv. raphani]